MNPSEINKAKNQIRSEFPIVGVGASAGGLEAFKSFLKAIPKKSGLAYILVQHLPADHESTLTDILEKITDIPVREIYDNILIEPDHIYIIPSNKLLIATDHKLKLGERPSEDAKNMPIDIFLSSLAEIYGKWAVGIVLSGNGSDGTQGLKQIKKHAGTTFAQTLNSAAHISMPQNAMNAGTVDFILSPEEIPQQLLRLKQTLKNAQPLDKRSVEEKMEEDCFEQIYALLLVRRDVDFTFYKQSTIRRRIHRRMGIVKLKKKSDYLNYLIQNKAEQDNLFHDMLIPVTEFFRDSHVFDALCESVYPDLLKAKSLNNPLRIWVVGCSTGQEVYSFAICLKECMGEHFPDVKIQIFATDISEKSIAKARSGNYLKKEIKGISEIRLERFFNKSENGFQVKREVRDMCVFASHNFLKDPPFAKIDIISCRNVLIYMNAFLQKKAFNTFHYALNEKGFLLLGKSETTINSSELFLIFDKRNKIYSHKSVQDRHINITERRNENIFRYKSQIKNKEPKVNDFEKNANDVLLAQYMPSGVIVNDHFDIVQFRGASAAYLAPSPGKASLNVLKMVREGLAFELRNALYKSKATREPFIKEDIPVDKGMGLITIEVIPLLNTIEPYYLVLFKEETRIDAPPVEPEALDNKKNQRILQLEKELDQLRKDMHTITEEQEDVNEELQSANEELLSDSEELQSLNEELETSTEELQSTNEELMTVNQELFERNDQLNKSRKFAESIIETLHEPLIILDKKWRIKKANQAFYKDFKLKEVDCIGKVIFDLQNNSWNIPGLQNAFFKIQKKKEKVIDLEATHNFPSIGLRTICFNLQAIKSEMEEQLILLAFEDITERLIAEQAAASLKERQTLYNFFMQASGSFCVLKGSEHIFEFANPSYCHLIGNRDPIGKKIREVLPELKSQGFFEILDDVYRTGKPFIGKEMPISLNQKGGGQKERFLNFNYEAFTNSKGEIDGILVFAYDITEQVLAQNTIRESEQKYRRLMSGLPIAIYTCNKEGYIQLYNDAAAKLWGRNPELGKEMWCGSWKIFATDGSLMPLDECPMAVALKEDRIIHTELIVERQDGSRCSIIPYPQTIHDAHGEIIGAINTLVDITERVKTKKAMQKNVEMMNELYMNATAFVCILRGKEYEYELVNPAYQKLYGKRDLLGKKLKEVHPELDNQKIFELLDNVYKTGKTFVGTELQLVLSRDEGKEPEPVYLNFSYQPMFNSDSQVDGILVFGYDVTNQVMTKIESEESLKKVLEFLPVMTWTNLPNGHINFFNQKWYNYTGLENGNADIWKWRTLVHPDDLSKTMNAYRKALSTGQLFKVENRYKGTDDTYRWHLNQALPIMNRDKEIELWVGTATDIHEQKIKEQKKDEFISIASHEMKTPLTTAKAYLQLLQEVIGSTDNKAGLYVQKANVSIERLQSLITELLDVSKIQNGRLDYHIAKFDFNEMLDATIETMQYSTPSQVILKKGKVSKEITGDKEKLQQVVINLLSNAIKYSPDSREISVNVQQQNEIVTVSITDKGIGISKENLEKVFERYYRVEEHAIQFQGLGIGLFISKEIINHHNGQLWVESEKGKGSSFYFTLPLIILNDKN